MAPSRAAPSPRRAKARSSRNALQHGLRARQLILVAGEDAAEFRAFANALPAELGPEGALQTDLVARIAITAWRARRSDHIKASLFARYLKADAYRSGPDFGAALIRDGHGPRALDTLLRYRGSAQAELFRTLAALKTLQSEARPPEPGATILAPVVRDTKRTQDDADSSES